jgi:hypothetical protein
LNWTIRVFCRSVYFLFYDDHESWWTGVFVLKGRLSFRKVLFLSVTSVSSSPDVFLNIEGELIQQQAVVKFTFTGQFRRSRSILPVLFSLFLLLERTTNSRDEEATKINESQKNSVHVGQNRKRKNFLSK